MNGGWIKIHKKIKDWEWYQDSKVLHVFLHLLLSANFEPKNWKGTPILRGQFIGSPNNISALTGVSIQSVRTALKKLEKTKELTIKATNKYSLYTLLNYDSYQENENTNKPLTNKQQTTNKPLTTTKEYKKIRSKEEKNKKVVFTPPVYEEFLEYALSVKSNLKEESVKLKFMAWKEAGWVDGNEKKINNWKSKLLNTIPHLQVVEIKKRRVAL
jgi:hypothetical protein